MLTLYLSIMKTSHCCVRWGPRLQEMTTAHVFAQPGDSTDLSVQVLEKQPQITVDDDGGLFFTSRDHPGAHILVSGDDRRPDRPFSGHMV